MLVKLLAICLLSTLAVACEMGACPPFELTNLAGDYTNYSYTTNWTIAKRRNGPTANDTARCLNTTFDGAFWSTTCTWSLNCSAHNGSVVFRKLYVGVKKGDTVQVTNFSIWNWNILRSPLITLGGLYIPQDSYSSKEYTYAPDTLITGNSSHNAEVSLTITSTRPATSAEYEVDVHLNFTCSRIYRYVYVELSPDLPDNGGFWSIFAAYILPGIIIVIIIIIALLRYCNPDLTLRLKKWAGFKELDDEARTRHAKIKDRSGGGTWHDHAAEVVSDLKKNKIEEIQARNEIEDSDEELDNFTPIKAPAPKSQAPVKPNKEQSGDSIDLDDDGPKARTVPPKRAVVKSSDDDLEFSDDDDDELDLGKKALETDSDDDVL